MGLESERKGEAPVTVTPDDAARYIEGMSAELSRLARQSGFDLLAYLLEVAREEAAARSLELSSEPKTRLS